MSPDQVARHLRDQTHRGDRSPPACAYGTAVAEIPEADDAGCAREGSARVTRRYDPGVQLPSIDAARFREVLGHFASGVTVVTATDETPVGFTCQAFAALSLDPPMVLLAPAKSSTSWPRIAGPGRSA